MDSYRKPSFNFINYKYRIRNSKADVKQKYTFLGFTKKQLLKRLVVVPNADKDIAAIIGMHPKLKYIVIHSSEEHNAIYLTSDYFNRKEYKFITKKKM